MRFVQTRNDVGCNIRRLATYLHSIDELIKRGICFLVGNLDGKPFFAPSKFVGYADNSLHDHLQKRSSELDGGKTNRALEQLLGSKPEQHAEKEALYREFGRSEGIVTNPFGSCGTPRKYWDIGEIGADCP